MVIMVHVRGAANGQAQAERAAGQSYVRGLAVSFPSRPHFLATPSSSQK